MTRNVKVNKDRVRKVFDCYVSAYNAADSKIRLKIYHAYRFADLAGKKASSIDVDEDFSWLCGVLHEFGRFEQVKRYSTFSDAMSTDYVEFGADRINEKSWGEKS